MQAIDLLAPAIARAIEDSQAEQRAWQAQHDVRQQIEDLQPPDIKTLTAWQAEGGCEAACEHGCWVEPDGTCEHGRPSWLIVLGMI